MKRFSFFIFLLVLVFNLTAEISVKSFRRLDNDLDARVTAPIKDQNGAWCAIIKVVTTQTGFSFDNGMIGIVKTENKSSEIWVYVPFGTKRLTIMHPKLGQLRDYILPESIDKATVYELVLTTGKVITTVDESIESQWLLIKAQPAKAMIYLNEQFVKAGEYQAKLKPGKYTYRVEAPLYHTDAGIVEIADSKKELNVVLKPAFGYINITSTPESGAMVMIDGKEQPIATPCQSEPVASGEHTVQVVKEMYQPLTQKVLVADGQTTPIKIALQPNFAVVSVTTPADASVSINGLEKGKGNWQGRLNAGVYSIEATKAKHRPAKQDIDVVAGDTKTVDLQPTPIYGSLDVMTTPSGATITIGDKEYGTTPNTINRLLIGDYSVKLTKEGYASITKSTIVAEGKSTELNETLSNGRAVTINSTPTGVNLFVDGVASGKTPYSGSLTYGNHTLKIENNGKTAEKIVSITQSGRETSFLLSFELLISDIDGNIYHSVTIGTQTWMVENLKTTHYRNGDQIPNVTDNNTWGTLSTGACCDYDNSGSNSIKYGHLYNWYAVSDSRNIAPKGWHLPTDEEWIILCNYVSNNSGISGTLAKSLASKTNWTSSTVNGTVGKVLSKNNSSGFSALSAGERTSVSFGGLGSGGFWWSTNEYDISRGICRYIGCYDKNTVRYEQPKMYGCSIRCIRDF